MKLRWTALSVILFALSSQAFAGYELVCKGASPTGVNKPIVFDCNDRSQVVNMLGLAWKEVRANGIGGSTEDMYWKP